MMNETEIWLERLNSLYKSQMRQAVSTEGIQLVHFEILQYLSICNDYSNTAQALVEYLGQTKGSISQSLKIMEKSGYIERKPCLQDTRAIRLHLTKDGKACFNRVSQQLGLGCENDVSVIEPIKSLLVGWQGEGGHKGFGQCQSCRYNQTIKGGKFLCGLTNDLLSKADITKICREHEFDI